MIDWLHELRRRRWRRQVEDAAFLKLLDTESPSGRTRFEDLDLLVREARAIGAELVARAP